METQINDMVIAKVAGDLVSNAVLGCNDKTLKVMSGEDVHYSVPANGAVKTLQNFYVSDEESSQNNRLVLYGTENGYLGLVQLERNSFQEFWRIEP